MNLALVCQSPLRAKLIIFQCKYDLDCFQTKIKLKYFASKIIPSLIWLDSKGHYLVGFRNSHLLLAYLLIEGAEAGVGSWGRGGVTNHFLALLLDFYMNFLLKNDESYLPRLIRAAKKPSFHLSQYMQYTYEDWFERQNIVSFVEIEGEEEDFELPELNFSLPEQNLY
ncbi:hypothetical protein BpHYR1_040196 [Brachionus plicatilis]|uniref:Uncharacterized protein n=1 Tax=Brachionus plicatilis TaxID=10195 RepID=A0A3M7QMK9_BRAPC|nr:hypothetical protein BpHYR1_040196 [Brachionus plicatilis]